MAATDAALRDLTAMCFRVEKNRELVREYGRKNLAVLKAASDVVHTAVRDGQYGVLTNLNYQTDPVDGYCSIAIGVRGVPADEFDTFRVAAKARALAALATVSHAVAYSQFDVTAYLAGPDGKPLPS